MRLLAKFTIVADTVRESMLPWVKVWVFSLFLSFDLLQNLSLLLLSQFLSVYTGVLGLDCG